MHTPKGNLQTATYGSEFVAARTAVDQIIDIRTTLQYLGDPIRDKSYMFGENRSVVTSSTIPNSTISKRHHLASYHRVREAIAAKYISFHWKDGKSNPADILSKHWEFATVWPMLKPILFWRGDTATQLKGVTEFRQAIQVQIHLEMPGILVKLGHTQRT